MTDESSGLSWEAQEVLQKIKSFNRLPGAGIPLIKLNLKVGNAKTVKKGIRDSNRLASSLARLRVSRRSLTKVIRPRSDVPLYSKEWHDLAPRPLPANVGSLRRSGRNGAGSTPLLTPPHPAYSVLVVGGRWDIRLVMPSCSRPSDDPGQHARASSNDFVRIKLRPLGRLGCFSLGLVRHVELADTRPSASIDIAVTGSSNSPVVWPLILAKSVYKECDLIACSRPGVPAGLCHSRAKGGLEEAVSWASTARFSPSGWIVLRYFQRNLGDGSHATALSAFA